MIDASGALLPFDVHLARETLLEALSAAVFTGRHASGGLLDVAQHACDTPLPPGEPATSGDLLLDGLVALYLDGHETGAPLLRIALASLDDDAPGAGSSLRWLGFGCLAAGALADYERLHTLADSTGGARPRGGRTRRAHPRSVLPLHGGGRRRESERRGHTLRRGPRDSRGAGDPAGLGEVIVRAWQGREAEARAEAATAIQETTERRQSGVLIYAKYSLAVLELSLGNYQEALRHAREVEHEDSFFLCTISLPDLVEAAVRGGDRDAALGAAERLRVRSLVNATPFALGMLARASALLSDDNEAEGHYVEAIRLLGSSRAAWTSRARASSVRRMAAPPEAPPRCTR